MTYALRGCHSALLVGSKSALASCSQVATGGDRWLLTAVRGHLGGTRPKCVGQVLGGVPPSNDRTRRLRPAAPGICPVTARTVQGMAPYPGQARCLALGCWPECFRRLDVMGGRRPFPKETRSALDIEGKHVTIQGPSPDLSPPGPLRLRRMPIAPISSAWTVSLGSRWRCTATTCGLADLRAC